MNFNNYMVLILISFVLMCGLTYMWEKDRAQRRLSEYDDLYYTSKYGSSTDSNKDQLVKDKDCELSDNDVLEILGGNDYRGDVADKKVHLLRDGDALYGKYIAEKFECITEGSEGKKKGAGDSVTSGKTDSDELTDSEVRRLLRDDVDDLKQNQSFNEFVQDSERKAAAGDKTSELLVKGLDSLKKNGDISGVDPKLILEVYLPKAEAGDDVAEYFVGMVYYQRNNMKEAAHWLELAAEHGNKEAYYYIGSLYFAAMGVERDYKKAEKYLLKATEQDNAMAEAMLMTLYSRGGDGVPRDTSKALHWAEKAAAGGNAQAQLYLGGAYRNGIGVEVDYGKAQKYIEMAAEQLDDPFWWCELGTYYLNIGDSNPGVIVDKEKGLKLVKKSAEAGCSVAQGLLAGMYLNGYYVETDYKEGYKWAKLAVDQGDSKTFILLGNMYEQGLYVNKDINKAIEYYKIVAEKGEQYNFGMLGMIYEKGRGVDKDLEKAKYFYNKGAALGDKLSLKRLSIFSKKAESMDVE